MADNKGLNNCQCGTSVENQTQQTEEQSFAMMMFQEARRNGRRWFIVAITVLVMWLITIGAFLVYLNQYCFESEAVVVDSKDGGNANYQTGSGVINNGKSDSN